MLLVFLSVAAAIPAHAAIDEPERDDLSRSALDSTKPDVDDEAADVFAVPVAGPFEFPWAIAVLPDGRVLLTERTGRLRIVQDDANVSAQLSGTPPVLSGGHGGLLDVRPAPDFADSHELFLSYVHGRPDAAVVRVMRGRLEGTRLVEQSVIFESRPPVPGLEQLGGRLAFGPDGCLFLTLGDRWEGGRAQDLLDHAGSIIRVYRDGTVPSDNPFAGRPDALPEIYSYGHRNPQGLVAHGGRLWSVEHGPQGGDELNVIEPGANYGWPLATHGVDYDGSPIGTGATAPGVTPPLHVWVPSVAPSSLAAYDGAFMPPRWRDSLLVGTLAGETLIRLTIGDDGPPTEERLLVQHRLGRLRDVAVSSEGVIYLLTDGPEGMLYRLEPRDGDEVAIK
jgi:glucose/arabinose dehydrogenase